MDRRQFLKSSIALTFGASPLMQLACKPKSLKIGVQLYSVRREMGEDFEGTLTKIAEAGYDQVEFAGYYNKDPKEIKALLDKLEITSPANHTGYDQLTEKLDETIEAAKIIGHEYLILPSLPRLRPAQPRQPQQDQQGQRRRWEPPVYDLDQVKKYVEIFNELGEKCHKAGLGFAYHNHTFEFQKIKETETRMYDMLLKETDPKLVDFEIDIGWAVVAGADPLQYFANYPGRFKFFHIKDMNEENRSVAVGKGKIDWAPILLKSKQAGVKYYIVEYEGREDPVTSCAESVKYLKNLKL